MVRMTASAMHMITKRTYSGGRPRPIPTAAAPYSMTSVAVMRTRADSGEMLNVNAAARGSTRIRIRPRVTVTDRCLRQWLTALHSIAMIELTLKKNKQVSSAYKKKNAVNVITLSFCSGEIMNKT
jgi:hypothetical protein